MTESWEGFTSEEISKISNHKQQGIKSDIILSNSPVKKMIFKQNKFGKKNITRERMLKPSKKLGATAEGKTELPNGARLFIPQIPEEDEVEEPETQSGDKLSSSPPVPSELSNDSPPELPELLASPREANLEDFEKKQKMIQEQNRLRKEFLKKALEDRTKKTHEEARRLGQIEEELKKLDVQLSNDVSILRNQIEVASLEFMEAQKRFDRAEREYLDAKLALFTKRERKELLTGHLCTIIEQNELRKARKLSDLMDKLHLGSVVGVYYPWFVLYRKRFDRAEREYLDAKLALFTKRERKELLTGHLCTIIEQNELRKARKLSDLMDKLHLGSVVGVYYPWFVLYRKRFDRAEREYLDAKLALFTKRERKELLTGHLCTIIEQNELRKARKLSDLMDKLHLGSVIIERPFEAPEVPENELKVENKEDEKPEIVEPPT